MKEEESKDEKGLPPLTDEEEQAVRSANEVNNTEGVTTEQKQRHYNRMSEVYPNIKDMLREALQLPLKRYGGGSVRMTRSYKCLNVLTLKN